MTVAELRWRAEIAVRLNCSHIVAKNEPFHQRVRFMGPRIGVFLYVVLMLSAATSAGLSAWAMATHLFLVSSLILLALLVVCAVQDHWS